MASAIGIILSGGNECDMKFHCRNSSYHVDCSADSIMAVPLRSKVCVREVPLLQDVVITTTYLNTAWHEVSNNH